MAADSKAAGSAGTKVQPESQAFWIQKRHTCLSTTTAFSTKYYSKLKKIIPS